MALLYTRRPRMSKRIGQEAALYWDRGRLARNAPSDAQTLY